MENVPEENNDPRAVRSRTAILAGASRLLVKGGMEAVTHQAVAAESGVGRATIYRHWPKPVDLLMATLENTEIPLFDFGDGEVEEELLSSLTTRVAWFNQPIAGVVLGAVIGRADFEPEIDNLRERVFALGTELLAHRLSEAVRRGEICRDIPAHTVATMIIGAFLYERHLLGHQLTAPIIENIVRSALHGWRLPHDHRTTNSRDPR